MSAATQPAATQPAVTKIATTKVIVVDAADAPVIANPHSPDALDQVLVRIQALVADQGELANRIAAEMGLLAEVCETHFRAEEESAVYADLCEKAPWLAHQLENVIQQHRELRKHLISLCGCSERQRPLPRGWQEFAEELAFFRRQLQSHEELERDLWQQAFTADLGSKD